MSSNKMTIGDYLLRRLKAIGVDIIFGVPGDYNLVQYLIFFLLFVTTFSLNLFFLLPAISRSNRR